MDGPITKEGQENVSSPEFEVSRVTETTVLFLTCDILFQRVPAIPYLCVLLPSLQCVWSCPILNLFLLPLYQFCMSPIPLTSLTQTLDIWVCKIIYHNLNILIFLTLYPNHIYIGNKPTQFPDGAVFYSLQDAMTPEDISWRKKLNSLYILLLVFRSAVTRIRTQHAERGIPLQSRGRICGRLA